MDGTTRLKASDESVQRAEASSQDRERRSAGKNRERFEALLQTPPQKDADGESALAVIAQQTAGGMHHALHPPENDRLAQPGAGQSEELNVLLQRLCSHLYLAPAQTADTAHMMLSLDAAAPGLAAEIVRDGGFLRVRLHARDEDLLRALSAGRDQLLSALNDSTTLHVTVEVVSNEDGHDGGTT